MIEKVEAAAEGASSTTAKRLGPPASETSSEISLTQNGGDGNIVADLDKAAEFLRRHAAGGEVQLHAIEPDGPIKTQTFPTEDGRREFLERWNGHRNLYFTVNPLKPSAPRDSKPHKWDIAALAWAHVDIDPVGDETPDRTKARALPALRVQPWATAIIDSGGGVQAFWRLKEPIAVTSDPMVKLNAANKPEATNPAWHAEIERLEATNKKLIAHFGGDRSCSNLDRIMRVPGTINLPTATKKAKGRVACAARLHHIADFAYDLEQVAALASTAQAPSRAAGDLDADLKAKLDKVLSLHPHIRARWGGSTDGLTDDSRSAMDMSMTSLLKARGFTRQEIKAILKIWPHGKAAEQKQAYVDRAYDNSEVRDPDKFICNDQGEIYKDSQHNIRLAVKKLGVAVSHDVFADQMPITGLDRFEILDDAGMNRLWLLVDSTYHFRPTYDLFYRVVTDEARCNPFHPVRDYLDECQAKWDGTPRLDNWLIRHGGADDTPYVRAVSALPLIAAVRRVRRPGCKFDEMAILEAEQGTNKSGAIAALSPLEEWFSDDLPLNSDSQEVIERTSGKWLIEAAELSGMKRAADVEHLKSFMSRRVDRARPAYGRLPVDRPRQFILFGTTNESKFLRDGTGNRRFWPVRVPHSFDVAAIAAERDQLWGEAATREAASERSIRLDRSLWPAAADQQEERRAGDPWEDRVRTIFKALVGKVTIEDAFKVVGKFRVADRTQHDQEFLGAAMRRIGFEHNRLHFGSGGKVGCYVRGAEHERGQIICIVDVVDMFGGKVDVKAEYAVDT